MGERRIDQSFGGHSHSQHFKEVYEPNNASFKLDPITHKKTYRPVQVFSEPPAQLLNYRTQVSLPQYKAF